jgi:biopolymer transport protein ExbB
MINKIFVLAQASGTEYTMQMTETTGSGEVSFLTMFLKGGYILIPIVLLSIVAVYRFQKYLDIRRNRVSIGYGPINDLLRKGDIKAASVHLDHEKTSYANIFRRVIGKIGKSAEEIENTLESASNIEIARVSKHLGYLGLIAGIAPMLGFIGTISGIIKIFYNISLTDNISIGIISGGLYEKMISSGTGLIVGIIAFTGYHILNMRIDHFISQVEEEAFEL